MTANDRIRWIAKPVVFALCLLPLAWLLWRAAAGDLGVNANETVNRFLGDWALRFLLVALAVSPAGGVTGWAVLVRFRRMLGLFAFAYALLHLTSYAAVDQAFDWREIWADVVKRNFITVGMVVFALLTPLALTSTKGMVKRLGAARWRRLHRLVYAAGVGGVVHFYMMIKADLREPLIYGAILAVLLGYRVVSAARRRAGRRRNTPRAV